MVAAGLLTPEQAQLVQAAQNSGNTVSGQRIVEDTLRVMEQRIDLKSMTYFRDLAQRVSAHPDAPLDAAHEAQLLHDALLPELTATAQLGGQATLLAAAQNGSGIGFAWGQINEQAVAWAELYTSNLVKQITDTTLSQMQTAVAMFHATPGMTRGQLEKLILDGPSGIEDLTSKTGRIISASERAEMIAVTEVTRSYSAGEVVGLRASGLPMVEPTQKPPAHVKCRCDISPFPRPDGIMSWHWLTLNDELVCSICADLNGMDVGENA
jgi:hypothetical protein